MLDMLRKHIVRATTVACALVATGGALAVPSTQFSVTGGAITDPSVYTLDELQALPAITQTVNYTAAGVPQVRSYTGASLWGIVDGAGLVNDPTVNNDVLNKYFVATGTDGYRAVFSLGELHPDFGRREALAAYSELVDGQPTPLGDDGFARITSPGDVRGGHYVSKLMSLDIQRSGSTLPGIGGGPSTGFHVSGEVIDGGFFDLAALQALPSVTETANNILWTGVSLWDLLNTTTGLEIDPDVHNDVLGMYLVATGSDGYKVVFSLGELNPNFGNQPVFIAYEANGEPLGENGFARLVVPNDDRRGRWVSNLIGLEVFNVAAVPEPGTHALLLLGLVGIAARRAIARRQPDA